MVSERLKQIIFKQLYKELSNVEIIPYRDSIYFIDRDKKYWYFEYEKSGELWWRYDFFTSFFLLFSLEPNDYQKIMGDWVEEVLNCKVDSTGNNYTFCLTKVEEVLNCKVTSTDFGFRSGGRKMEEVLNCKVTSTPVDMPLNLEAVEEVLNCKVTSTIKIFGFFNKAVEEVLNCKVDSTNFGE